uniref:Uncharacterized protein n=1 Tax=Anguilla anguilla TaxID=7936 RepID=A0A0E9TRD8_ANGAN
MPLRLHIPSLSVQLEDPGRSRSSSATSDWGCEEETPSESGASARLRFPPGRSQHPVTPVLVTCSQRTLIPQSVLFYFKKYTEAEFT